MVYRHCSHVGRVRSAQDRVLQLILLQTLAGNMTDLSVLYMYTTDMVCVACDMHYCCSLQGMNVTMYVCMCARSYASMHLLLYACTDLVVANNIVIFWLTARHLRQEGVRNVRSAGLVARRLHPYVKNQ